MILNRSIEWLSKFGSEELYVTSAVLMANYMRNGKDFLIYLHTIGVFLESVVKHNIQKKDERVMNLMNRKSEPHKKLLDLLSRYSQTVNTATMQHINVMHSLLGSLRNFCVCQAARNILADDDLTIPVVCKFLLDSDNYEILFKCACIIRFLVRTASAKASRRIEPILDEACLKRIDDLSCVETHVGVANEISRLVCQLPLATASNRKLFDRLASFNFAKIVCKQLASEHLIMINEALLAVNALATIDYSKYIYAHF